MSKIQGVQSYLRACAFQGEQDVVESQNVVRSAEGEKPSDIWCGGRCHRFQSGYPLMRPEILQNVRTEKSLPRTLLAWEFDFSFTKTEKYDFSVNVSTGTASGGGVNTSSDTAKGAGNSGKK